MSEGTYDAEAIIGALSQSPIFGTNVQTISVNSVGTILLLFNEKRAFCVIQNSGSVLYVKLGTGVTLANYSFRLSSNAFASIDKWDGVISAVRETEINDVIVTEVF